MEYFFELFLFYSIMHNIYLPQDRTRNECHFKCFGSQHILWYCSLYSGN